jgi:hypothetical protein
LDLPTRQEPFSFTLHSLVDFTVIQLAVIFQFQSIFHELILNPTLFVMLLNVRIAFFSSHSRDWIVSLGAL